MAWEVFGKGIGVGCRGRLYNGGGSGVFAND